MMNPITAEHIAEFADRLNDHPIYKSVTTIQDLQVFMQHHIYSVWDFMSLIKYLQSIIAPTTYPWTPQGDGNVRRFINELVLEEESDETIISGQHSSHFELYLSAMREVGADTQPAQIFIESVQQDGVDIALALPSVPAPSKAFTSTTFTFIQQDKPHQVAAALALGREHIIPGMFRSILKTIGITGQQAPIFHYYLNRHIGLDEDFHAPLSLRLLNNLCGDDKQKTQEALEATDIAINARLAFWDGVLEAINS